MLEAKVLRQELNLSEPFGMSIRRGVTSAASGDLWVVRETVQDETAKLRRVCASVSLSHAASHDAFVGRGFRSF